MHLTQRRRLFSTLSVLVALSLSIAACGATPTVTPTPTRVRAAATATQPAPAPTAPAVAASSTATPNRAVQLTATPVRTAAPATAVATATAAKPTATTAPAKPTTAPVAAGRMASPEYGAHVFLGYDDAATQRDLQLAKDAGFQWVKQIFLWDALSPDEQGQMKPDVLAKYDKIVEQAQAQGLKLMVRVGSPPTWASKLRSAGPNPPPDDLSETGPMANFLYGLAGRYKGKVAAWQIWNEPNLKPRMGQGARCCRVCAAAQDGVSLDQGR